MTKKIQLIIGSTREGRLAPSIARWVEAQVTKLDGIDLQIVDLKEINLPFFNEATPPLYAPTATEAGKAWAALVGEADGFIFLTPEYNRGYPAALKNAIDYLVTEWNKPAAIVSYGYTNGGLGANKQLHEVLGNFKTSVSEELVAIHLKADMFGVDRSLKDTTEIFAQYEEALQTALTHLITADRPKVVTN